MKRYPRRTFGITAALLILFIINVGVIKNLAPWPAPVLGVSLEPKRPFLAATNIGSENAYFYLRKMTNEYPHRTDLPRDYYALWTNGWKPGVFTNVTSWMANNQADHLLYAKASTVTNSQAASEHPFEGGDVNFATLDFHRLLAFEIARLIDEQQTDEALKECVQLFRNGANLEQGSRRYERESIAKAEVLTCRILRDAAVGGRLSCEQIHGCTEILQWRDEHYEPCSETMRYEAAAWLRQLPKIASASLTELPLEPDASEYIARFIPPALYPLLGSTRSASKRHVSAWATHLIVAADDPGVARRVRTLKTSRFDNLPMRKALFNDPIANATCIAMNWDLGLLNLNAGTRARLRTTRAVLAVERWLKDKGRAPPVTLLELVPNYLGQLPEDPYAKGSNLLYRMDGTMYVVYSVGSDSVDDGGDVDGSRYRDLGWRVPLERHAVTDGAD